MHKWLEVNLNPTKHLPLKEFKGGVSLIPLLRRHETNFKKTKLPLMEDFKRMSPLLGRLRYNLVNIGNLEEPNNHSTMNNQEGRKLNLMHPEGLYSIATIVA